MLYFCDTFSFNPFSYHSTKPQAGKPDKTRLVLLSNKTFHAIKLVFQGKDDLLVYIIHVEQSIYGEKRSRETKRHFPMEPGSDTMWDESLATFHREGV